MAKDYYTLSEVTAPKKDSYSLSDMGISEPYAPFSDQRDNDSLAALLNAFQGTTFNFGDEILGKLTNLDPGRLNATVQQYREDYPASSTLGTVGGSMLLPFGTAAKFLRQFNPLATTAAAGGASAALSGAGEGDGMRDRGEKAVTAGAIGIPMALGMTKAGGAAIDALGPRIPKLGDDLTSLLARNRVATAFQRDQIKPEQALATGQRLGPEATVFDTGGDAVFNALDTNATLPGRTGQAVKLAQRARHENEFDRMLPMVNMVNNNGGRASANMAFWQQAKEKASAPLYAAYEKNPIQNSPKLAQLLQVAEDNGLLKRAKELHEFETKNPFSFGVTDQYQDPRALNYIKQSVDDRIEKALTQGDNNLVRALTKYKNDLIETVDKSSGGLYKPALEAFAGPASLQSALTAGRHFWSSKPDDLGITMRGLSSSEQEAFRIGAAEALRDKIGGQAGRTELINIWKNNTTKEKLQELLGDDVKYSDVVRLLEDTEKLRRLNSVNQGSATARRQVGMEDQAMGIDTDLLAAGVSAKTGNFLPMIGQASKRLGTPEPVRDEIGRLLLSRNLSEELLRLKEAQETIRKWALGGSTATGALTGNTTNRYQ